MRILMISSDPQILKEGSRAERRMREYAMLVDELAIILATKGKKKIESRHFSERGTITVKSYFEMLFCRPKGTFDLVTAQDPFVLGFFGYCLAKKLGIPLELQIHTDIGSPAWQNESFKNHLYFLLARFLLPRAQHIRVVSLHIGRFLVSNSKFRIPNSKIDVLPVFVDVEHFKNAPIAVDLHKKYPQFDKIILMLSRCTREKNIPLGIEAFRELLKTYPKAGLIVVGSGPESSRLKLLTTHYSLLTRVIFESWCDDPTSYYKTADCFLNTSLYEGYGMTIIEALASGCPVVSTDVGVAREAGANVTYDNPKSLAEAISETLGSKASKCKVSLNIFEKTAYLKAMRDGWERTLHS